MKYFRLLLESKKNFYLGDEENSVLVFEEKNLHKIEGNYKIKKLYYSLDNKDIFKRRDRYHFNRILIGSFALLIIFNVFEIAINIKQLVVRKKYITYSYPERLIFSLFSILNIINVFFLSSITIAKFRIKTYIYY